MKVGIYWNHNMMNYYKHFRFGKQESVVKIRKPTIMNMTMTKMKLKNKKSRRRKDLSVFHIDKNGKIIREDENPDPTEKNLLIGQDPNLFQELTAWDDPFSVATHSIILEKVINQIESAIFSHNPGQILPLFTQAKQHCNELDIEYEPDLELLRDVIPLTKITAGTLLYTPPKPSLIIPKLIIPTQSYFISLIKDKPDLLFNITPRQFEELIAELFHSFGFEVELTKATRDGGRDIIAVNETLDIKTKYLIECKRYSPNNKVSVSIVQRLYGVKMSEAANKGILVTTSSYTRDAREFASKHVWDLDLKAYDDIIGWVRKYKYPYGISLR